MAYGKRWTFTVNNYSEDELAYIKELSQNTELCKCLYCGRETGHAGTPHLQGYVEFTSKKRMPGIKAIPGFARAHLESAKGTRAENRAYCSKEGQLEIDVGAPALSNRSDLAELKEIVDKSDSTANALLQCAEYDFKGFLRFHKGISIYAGLRVSGERRIAPQVSVYWGAAGTGKTRAVFEQHPDVYWWPGERWFDGYVGQRVVLLDDYVGQLPFAFLLRVLDRYPLQVPIKGAFTWWKPEIIYITSNLEPKEWYNLEPRRMDALFRRLNEIKHFT